MTTAVAPAPHRSSASPFSSRNRFYPQFVPASTGLSESSDDLTAFLILIQLAKLQPTSFAVPLDVEFQTYAQEWKRESQFLSSPEQASSLPSYKRIIGMGNPALPLILHELRREPDLWFDALSSITGEQPVAREHAGDIETMALDWQKWGEDNGII
jgi:hypothetical protein